MTALNEVATNLRASETLTLGHGKRFVLKFTAKKAPFAIDRIASSSPMPGFVKLYDPRVQRDSYDYSLCSCAPDAHDLLPIKVGGPLTLLAEYTGVVPPGFKRGQAFNFELTLYGKIVVAPMSRSAP
jgi:hypothetical protein